MKHYFHRTRNAIRSNAYTNYTYRIIIGILAATLFILGVAMLVLPGPGILVIIAALALAASEFAFAKRWLHRARKRYNTIRHRKSSTSQGEKSNG